MNVERATAWTLIVVAALLIGFALGRWTAPDAGPDAVATEGTPTETATAEPTPTPTPAPVTATTPEPEPTTEAPPTVAPTPTAEPRVYVVQPGDTLTGIAQATYGDPFCFDEIAAANGLDPEAGLLIGAELVLPDACP